MSTDRDTRAAEIAAELPESRAELLAAAAEAARQFDAAVMAEDEAKARTAQEWAEAIVWKLNGGTLFGCRADRDSSAGYVIERHCAAVPGTAPRWGQSGEFLITVEGIRAVVEYRTDFGGMQHFSFHAVDLDAPFISETGYRSHFFPLPFGYTVTEAAEGILAAFIQSDGRKVLAPDSRRFREQAEPRPWLAELEPLTPADLTYEDSAGQMAFGF